MKLFNTLLLLLLIPCSALAQSEVKSNISPGCQTKIHISEYKVETGKTISNWATENQIKWLEKDLIKKYPSICISDDISQAQYIFVWVQDIKPYTYNYTVPVTANSRTTGSVGWNTVTLNNKTVTYVPQTATGNTVYVTGVIARWDTEQKKYVPVSMITKSGEWRWSKPDKDVMEESFKKVFSTRN
jgi:hypothetical protein